MCSQHRKSRRAVYSNLMDVVIIGAGGHGRELHTYVEECVADGQKINLLGFVDDSENRPENVYDSPVLGGSEWLEQHTDVMILLGIGNGRVRKALTERFGWERLASIIHPTARISRHTQYAPGFQAMPMAATANNNRFGLSVFMNIQALVGHDTTVGDFVTIAPNVGITADIEIGQGVTFGTGANVIPGKRIGEWATIAAGATVVKHIGAGITVFGTPARSLKDALRLN